jgi:hypothetical protein
MTPIERAARALHAEFCKQWDVRPWEDEPEVNRKAFLAEATAALTAAYPGLMSSPPTWWLVKEGSPEDADYVAVQKPTSRNPRDEKKD